MQKSTGFNLIELMITLAIIGILSAICLPVYSEHLIHARRLLAETALIKLDSALQKYYFVNNTYENATLARLDIPNKIAGGQYQLQIASARRNDFLIKAVPLFHQAEADARCGTLSLDSTGQKSISGTAQLNECWQ